MASPWEWDKGSRRYRDTRTGKWMKVKRVKELRDDFVRAQSEHAATLAGELAAGTRSVQAWTDSMRELVKVTHGAEYALGRGGRNAMTKRDWGRVGAAVKKQYGYLQKFAEDVQGATLSEAQIAARATLYVSSAVGAHERGAAAAWGVTLPAYPGDGTSECLANDRCHWSFSETPDAVEATWVARRDANICTTCSERGDTWNPYIVAKSA